jgi:hypothetical protein
MTVKPDIIEVTYLDHCFDDTEKTLEEIDEHPISPAICTVIGYKTFENDEYLTVSCERTNNNTADEPYFSYSNHITIVKSTITEIKKMKR